MRTVFILRNEELDYTDICPVFQTYKEAWEVAACKAREHSVLEVPDTFQRCCPKHIGSSCQRCAIFVGKK